jgi:predicted alpha-1,6-mannanase (GH76 family)
VTVSAVSWAERDRLVIVRLLTFHRPWRGKWHTPTGEAWQPALAVEAVLNTYERTLEPRYRAVVERSFARYRGRRSRFFDDDGWYLNAWLRAYDLTGEQRYLDEARSLFTGMTTAWDDTCRGGLWWRKDRDYKNAITNELFLLAAAGLHRRAPDGTRYLDWAVREWEWFDASGMINSADEVNDGLDSSCANNGRTTWTYNQGVVLGGLAELWRVTGDRGYLERAWRIADATIRTHVDAAGVLREPGEPASCGRDHQAFKGVFAQGLARLYDADRDARPEYRRFLSTNAEAAWQGRDERDGVGLCWAGPAEEVTAATQTAAALLIGSVALLAS